jgi:hypothetical protein
LISLLPGALDISYTFLNYKLRRKKGGKQATNNIEDTKTEGEDRKKILIKKDRREAQTTHDPWHAPFFGIIACPKNKEYD